MSGRSAKGEKDTAEKLPSSRRNKTSAREQKEVKKSPREFDNPNMYDYTQVKAERAAAAMATVGDVFSHLKKVEETAKKVNDKMSFAQSQADILKRMQE